MYYLLVKIHNETGLKYFCKHEGTKESAIKYCGSGKYWRKHLRKHGRDLLTEIVFETTNLVELKRLGQYYSELWNIVESEDWANLAIEMGDGGTRVSVKGKNHPNHGRKLTEEHKQKISGTLKGRENTWQKGILVSEETKKKMRGRTPWNKGKIDVYSQESLQKMSESLKGKIAWNRGTSTTIEIRQKISQTLKETNRKTREAPK